MRVDLNEKQNIRSSLMAIHCKIRKTYYSLNIKGNSVLISLKLCTTLPEMKSKSIYLITVQTYSKLKTTN